MRYVTIRNVSQGTVVATQAEVADNFLRRGVGLLGRAGLPEGGGLVITPCSNIHMLGMRFALDVVFLDKAGRVVKVYADLRPWRPYAGARGAHTTLELPVGAIAQAQVAVGDQLELAPLQG